MKQRQQQRNLKYGEVGDVWAIFLSVLKCCKSQLITKDSKRNQKSFNLAIETRNM